MNASGSVLLDTTIVVEHLRGNTPSIAQRFKEVTTIYLPLTVLGELLYGAYNSAAESKSLKQIEDFLKICAILRPGERTAHYYGRIKANLAQRGKPIPQNDIWIAAVASEHRLPVATRDRAFFFHRWIDHSGLVGRYFALSLNLR
jgi:tRNA(fMet)-specific endonuclease VapC